MCHIIIYLLNPLAINIPKDTSQAIPRDEIKALQSHELFPMYSYLFKTGSDCPLFWSVTYFGFAIRNL